MSNVKKFELAGMEATSFDNLGSIGGGVCSFLIGVVGVLARSEMDSSSCAELRLSARLSLDSSLGIILAFFLLGIIPGDFISFSVKILG